MIKLNKKTQSLLKILVFGIIIIIIFTSIFSFFDYSHFNGVNEKNELSLVNRIFNRLYFTVTTLSSSSYGDITPKTIEVKILSLLLQLVLIVSLLSGLLIIYE